MVNFLEQLFGAPLPEISAKEAAAKLKESPKPYLLDVREPSEFRAGHIAGATLIPLGELSRRIESLPKDREILCVCQSGSRSSSAARVLIRAGYNAVNLRHGMIGWQMAGQTMKRGS